MKKIYKLALIILLFTGTILSTSNTYGLEIYKTGINDLIFNYVLIGDDLDAEGFKLTYNITVQSPTLTDNYIIYFDDGFTINYVTGLKYEGNDYSIPGEEINPNYFKDIGIIGSTSFVVESTIPYSQFEDFTDTKNYFENNVIPFMNVANCSIATFINYIVIDSGYNYTSGYNQGVTDGFTSGTNATYDQGVIDGYSEGYRQGGLDYIDTTYDYSAELQEAYNQGAEDQGQSTFNEGYEIGLEVGEENGYNRGLQASLSEDLDIGYFLYMTFDGVGGFLSVELLPNISLGAIIAVPLIFGLISFFIGVATAKKGAK